MKTGTLTERDDALRPSPLTRHRFNTEDFTLRRQPKLPEKIHGKKLASGHWLVICPCCSLDWELENGLLALQVERVHADAHTDPARAVRP